MVSVCTRPAKSLKERPRSSISCAVQSCRKMHRVCSHRSSHTYAACTDPAIQGPPERTPTHAHRRTPVRKILWSFATHARHFRAGYGVYLYTDSSNLVPPRPGSAPFTARRSAAPRTPRAHIKVHPDRPLLRTFTMMKRPIRRVVANILLLLLYCSWVSAGV